MMGPERRLAAIVRAVAGGMLFCLAFSGSLWISTRLYPLTPALGLVPPFPWPLDALAAAVLVGLLCVVLIRPLAWPPVAAVVIVLVALFAQDQSRLWPSFYTFFLLFVLAAGHDRHGGPTASTKSRKNV